MEQERVRRCEQAAELLPPRLRRLAMEIPDERKARVEELRLRVRAPLTVLTSEGELAVGADVIGALGDVVEVGDLAQQTLLNEIHCHSCSLLRPCPAGGCRRRTPP